MPLPRRARLSVCPLEGRLAPAFDLSINGHFATTSHVTSDTDTIPGTTVFSPDASGAVLGLDAIGAALQVGNVLITTGTGGAEAGNITYTSDGFQVQIVPPFPPRTLTIRPSGGLAAVGNVSITGMSLQTKPSLNLVIDTTAPDADGRIDLTDVTFTQLRSITLTAGDGGIGLSGAFTADSGDSTMSAAQISLGAGAPVLVGSAFGNVTLNGGVTLNGSELRVYSNAETGTINLNAAVDGPGVLTVHGRTVAINAPIGATDRVTTLRFEGGDVTHGANPIAADTIEVGDENEFSEASFGAGTGTVTGDLVLLSDGNLTPGGVGTVGTLTLVGDLVFQGGEYALDVGAQADRVNVDGDVAIASGRLGNGQSTGVLAAAGDAVVIGFTGARTGTFANAPLGSGFYLAGDPVRLTSYGAGGPGVTVARVPAAPRGVVTGFEPDGTQYTFRLTGRGELVTFPDLTAPADQRLSVFVRNPSPQTRVTLTTKANGSNTTVDLGAVQVAGPIGTFGAPAAVLNGPFEAAGTARALTFGQVNGRVTLGGGLTDRTTVAAAGVASTITTPGILSAVTVSGHLTGTLSAAWVGAVKVGGQLQGAGPGWNIPGGIQSITAGRIEGLDLTASYLGTVTVTGTGHLSGDVSNSAIRLTGANGRPGGFGLKALTARGNVRNTRLEVRGDVGSVTVGRFVDSQLWVDYAPGPAFHAGGQFLSAARYRIGAFTTTAVPLGDPSSALNYAFAGSQVAADTLGTVRLSGLEAGNNGDAFGLKFRTAAGTVRVAAADVADPDLPFNTSLTPTVGPHPALAGDFHLLDA